MSEMVYFFSMKRLSFRYYDVIVALVATVLLISNLAATKLVAIGPFILDGGIILFPLAYILGDLLTEVYGFKFARRAIWISFGMMLLAVLAFTAVRYLPAAADYTDQASFEAVLGFFPRIVIASLAAFLVGSFVNAYVLAKLKVRTKGKFLWGRLVASSVLGQLLDTTVFCLIAFGGIIGASDMVNYVLVGFILKTVIEIIVSPVTYKVAKVLKKREGVDALDTKTNFSPFAFKD